MLTKLEKHVTLASAMATESAQSTQNTCTASNSIIDIDVSKLGYIGRFWHVA